MSTMTELPTRNLIVPENVTRGYLAKYNDKTLESIEELYQTIKNEAFSKMTAAAKPGASIFILVAGTQGVGKSEMVKRLLDGRKAQFVICDADSILERMPAVQAALSEVSNDLMRDHYDSVAYSTEVHRTKADAAVEKYRNAAKYLSDRLMSESIEAGYNVLVETNAKTPNIGAFLKAVKDTGVILEGHICEAPFRIKEQGAKSPQHGFSLPTDILKAEHEAFRKNTDIIAQACNKALTIWFRHQEKAGLSPIAVGTEYTYTTDLVGNTAFEAHFADVDGRTTDTLMGSRRNITSTPRIPIPEEFRVTV